MTVRWLQKAVKRPGQKHAFVDGSDVSLCRVGRLKKGTWDEAPQAMRCASCFRLLDPENAPKIPNTRGHQ